MRTALVILALAAAPCTAYAQRVKDLAEVEGARANKLRGYGIVTGLDGRGDSPRGESARMLRAMLTNLLAPGSAVQDVEARNAALVLVTAELPPFQKAGTRFDVSVSTVGDCESLHGGELQLTDLRGPLGRRDPKVYALASGRLVTHGDGGKGNPTTAVVPGGAITEHELEHRFTKEIRARIGEKEVRRKAFKLILRKPDLTTASQLAMRINEGPFPGAALALDGGSVLVRIPTVEEYRRAAGVNPEADYEKQPVRWLDVILNLPAKIASFERAAVVIGGATRTVSWTGDVRLHGGSVMLAAPDGRLSLFRAREGEPLSDFVGKTRLVLTDRELVEVVKALHEAGLLQAELLSR